MSDKKKIMEKYEVPAAELPGKPGFLRFPVPYRIEHWLFMLSFTTLAITGLVQKFAANPIPQSIIRLFGGIGNTRTIHHTAAIIMMFVVIYHIGAIGYRVYVRRIRFTMLPFLSDLTNAAKILGYNVGFTKGKVQQDRYTFEEKLEYWAVVWGTLIMGITGFMMWNPLLTTSVLPGSVIPAAKVAHGLEAILAVLSILVWHLYNVLVKYFNKSMFTGYISEHEMIEEHPIELANIKAGIDPPRVDEQDVKKRRKIYLPVYGVIAVLLVIGIYFFVAYEVTAITTVPPAEIVEVFVPLTPTPLPTHVPTATSAPVTAVTWDGGIGELLNNKCGNCHNNSQALGGLDLTSYESALAGGNSGLVIIPGDPEGSQLVIVQSAGDHTGQLSDEELQLAIDWIEAGAPEN